MTGWLGGYNFQWAWSSGLNLLLGCGSLNAEYKSQQQQHTDTRQHPETDCETACHVMDHADGDRP